MAELNVSGFNVPETPYREYEGTKDFVNTILQRQRFEYEKQRREQERQNQYRLFNIREVDQDTDFSKFKTGEERFDTYTQRELQNIKNKALSEYINLPPEEAKYKLGRDMQDLVSWHSSVMGNIGNLKEGLQALNRSTPNIDAQQAHELAYLNMANDYLEKDQSGRIVRKKPELVTPKNYIQEIFKPENLTQLNIDTSPFQKAIESIPKTSVGEKEYTSKRGYVHKFDWSGLKTDYSDIVEDERGRPKAFELRTDRKIGDIKLIPNDLKEYLLSQPQVRVAADRLWQQEKQRIEASGQKVDSRTEPELYDAFLYKMANQYLPHDIKIATGEVTPKPSSNVFNFYGSDFTGKGETTGNELDRIKQNIGLPSDDYSGEWTITGANVPKLTKAVLKTGGIEIGNSKPYRLVYDGGVIQEIRSIDGKELIATRDDMIVAQKKYDAERKGEGQKFGVPKEEEKPKTKSFNVIDPKTGKVILSGVSEADANKAKAKGYKIQ